MHTKGVTIMRVSLHTGEISFTELAQDGIRSKYGKAGHLQEVYLHGGKRTDLALTESLCNEILSLPIHPCLMIT